MPESNVFDGSGIEHAVLALCFAWKGASPLKTEHNCGTCRHYEASSTWRRGWCRNTLLYKPGYSQPVQQHELDCRRGRSDFWESADEPSRRSSGYHQLENRGSRL